jgi:hypothetical protein
MAWLSDIDTQQVFHWLDHRAGTGGCSQIPNMAGQLHVKRHGNFFTVGIQADRQDAAPGEGTLLPAWNPRGGSDSPTARYPRQGLPLSKRSMGPLRHSCFSLCK